MQTRFGDCVLDLSTRRLRRGSRATELSPKAYDLLEFLVACRPRALAKRELLKRLWPQTVVVEANLSNLIAEIRAAIGDDSRQPRFIRTVYGFGYAFSGDVEATPADLVGGRPSLCWLAGGGVRVQLPEGEHLIGRHPASIVTIDSPRVSRHHAAIRVERDQATLSDLGEPQRDFRERPEGHLAGGPEGR
jgi:DNA-binding winged helix-turn-helix (wHTH) protein